MDEYHYGLAGLMAVTFSAAAVPAAIVLHGDLVGALICGAATAVFSGNLWALRNGRSLIASILELAGLRRPKEPAPEEDPPEVGKPGLRD